MVRIFLTLILVLVCSISNAQKVENIVTDRPDQTESSVTLYKGFFQVEAGASIDKVAEFKS